MDQDKAVLCFEQALSVLPAVLRRAAGQLSETEKKAAEEIRLRAGRTMTVLLPDREIDTGRRGGAGGFGECLQSGH
jgi:stage III sporulation protein SpoIIIAA